MWGKPKWFLIQKILEYFMLSNKEIPNLTETYIHI